MFEEATEDFSSPAVETGGVAITPGSHSEKQPRPGPDPARRPWKPPPRLRRCHLRWLRTSPKNALGDVRLRAACVSAGPNLKPEVAHWAAASACDCGRTGGHSFCQTHWDWWSGLERRPGVFSYSNGRGRDSWTLYIALRACTCAYLRGAACAWSTRRCTALRLKQQARWSGEPCVSVGHFWASPTRPGSRWTSLTASGTYRESTHVGGGGGALSCWFRSVFTKLVLNQRWNKSGCGVNAKTAAKALVFHSNTRLIRNNFKKNYIS